MNDSELKKNKYLKIPPIFHFIDIESFSLNQNYNFFYNRTINSLDLDCKFVKSRL